MKKKNVLVTFSPEPEWKEVIERVLGGITKLTYLKECDKADRERIIENADVLVSFMVHNELKKEEFKYLREGVLIQTLLAGVDAVPFSIIPKTVTLCSNAGAWAEPMAEHILGMMLALGKNLLKCHKKMAAGDFYRDEYNTWFYGKTAGFIGYGGISKATAKLLRALGMKIMAINTSGKTEDDIDFIGSLKDMNKVLSESDVVIIAVPLTRHTKGLIGEKEFSMMKPNAILINPARGDIIQEKALYEHMKSHPDFKVGIDAWWIEPFTHGEFKVDYPFFDFDNFLGSPHNSNLVPEIYPLAAERAAENVKRFLMGEKPRNIVNPEDYSWD